MPQTQRVGGGVFQVGQTAAVRCCRKDLRTELELAPLHPANLPESQRTRCDGCLNIKVEALGDVEEVVVVTGSTFSRVLILWRMAE